MRIRGKAHLRRKNKFFIITPYFVQKQTGKIIPALSKNRKPVLLYLKIIILNSYKTI